MYMYLKYNLYSMSFKTIVHPLWNRMTAVLNHNLVLAIDSEMIEYKVNAPRLKTWLTTLCQW